MNKKNIIIIASILLVILVIAGLYGTLATGETALTTDNIYNITLTGNSNEVVVPAGTSKTVIYQITNTNKGKVNYGLVFAGDNIEVKVYDDTIDSQTGLIDYGETKFVKLIITNTGTSDSTASIKTVLGYENDSNLNQPNLVPSGHTFVTESYTKPSGGGNGSGSGGSSGTNLITHITNLYTSGNPTLGTNTNVSAYYQSYQDEDKTWGLMNDGLKIDNTQDETTTGLAAVVTDTTALISGTEGNIRYFGPSASVNNYIYFNCDTYPSTGCELWRIIGIVDGKVKIIKEDSIGSLAWDAPNNEGSDTSNVNNWKNASLQLFLNGLYYNRDTRESLTYYGGISGTSETPLNLVDIGITEATRNNNIISESVWYLGGYSTPNVYSNEMYAYERTNKVGTTILSGNPFTITSNIGLMYASDYGYGTNLSKCSNKLDNYSSSTDSYACSANNWLFNSMKLWLITPKANSPVISWYLYYSGEVEYETGQVFNPLDIRPVLYLNPELTIDTTTDGSSGNPYKLIVE